MNWEHVAGVVCGIVLYQQVLKPLGLMAYRSIRRRNQR